MRYLYKCLFRVIKTLFKILNNKNITKLIKINIVN